MSREQREQSEENRTVLGSFRVLDLTDEKGFMCGWVLASLGAEVIKIEPTGGDQARNIPPFYQDIPDPEKSLYYLAYNVNKKSITLDIETAEGLKIFKKLVKTSDFVIESFQPGYMDNLGLGYSELSKINTRVILTSITPFGQEGPYRDYKSSDLLCSGMSGFVYLTGDPDRAPLRVSIPQAYSLGGVEGAVATMIAHYYREQTGEGQQVDVSIREAMIKAAPYAMPWWDRYGQIMKRGGPNWLLRGEEEKMRVLWHCTDGWVTFSLPIRSIGIQINRDLVKWMDSEGMASDFLKNVDWDSLGTGMLDQALRDEMEKMVMKFCMVHNKNEIIEGMVARGVQCVPVCTLEDITKSKQLETRGYWGEIEYPQNGSTIRYPGAFIKASETPCVMTTRSPLIGEHNEEIYFGDIGISSDEFYRLKSLKVI